MPNYIQNPAIEQLKQAVSNNDIKQLNNIANDNPEVDLNNITPSGHSLLWWALAGVPNVDTFHADKFHAAMVRVILDLSTTVNGEVQYRINPTQPFMGMRPIDFARTLMGSVNTDWLVTKIARAEDRYRAPIGNVAAGAEVQMVDLLGGQNTHNRHMEGEIVKSIIKLYNQYWGVSGKPDITQLDAILNDIAAFIAADPELTAAQKKSALLGLERIKTYSSDSYQVSDTQSVVLFPPEILALVWQAAGETNTELVFDQGSAQDIIYRKRQIIKHLAQTQNEYGENHPACAPGTRNQIVAALVHIHHMVRTFPEGVLTKQAVEFQLSAIIKSKLQECIEQDFTLYKQLLVDQSIAKPTPAGKFLDVHRQSITEDLRSETEYQTRSAKEKLIVDEVLQGLLSNPPTTADDVDYRSVPFDSHQVSKWVSKMEVVFCLQKDQVFIAKLLAATNVEEITKLFDEKIIPELNTIIANNIFISNVRDKFFISDATDFNDLLLSKIKQLNFNFLDDDFDLGEIINPKLQNEVTEKSQKNLTDAVTDILIEEVRQKYLQKVDLPWFDALTLTQKREIVAEVASEADTTIANFRSNLITKAIQVGMTRNLSLVGHDFTGVDCRGFDFRGVNLTNADFSNATNLRFISFDSDTIINGAKFPEGHFGFFSAYFSGYSQDEVNRLLAQLDEYLVKHMLKNANRYEYGGVNVRDVLLLLTFISSLSLEEQIKILSSRSEGSKQSLLCSLMVYYPNFIVQFVAAIDKLDSVEQKIELLNSTDENGFNFLNLALMRKPHTVASLLDMVSTLSYEVQVAILSHGSHGFNAIVNAALHDKSIAITPLLNSINKLRPEHQIAILNQRKDALNPLRLLAECKNLPKNLPINPECLKPLMKDRNKTYIIGGLLFSLGLLATVSLGALCIVGVCIAYGLIPGIGLFVMGSAILTGVLILCAIALITSVCVVIGGVYNLYQGYKTKKALNKIESHIKPQTPEPQDLVVEEELLEPVGPVGP